MNRLTGKCQPICHAFGERKQYLNLLFVISYHRFFNGTLYKGIDLLAL